MTDSQNNNAAWNEWANYVLEISKRHDKNIDELFDELNKKCLDIESIREKKQDREDFQKFLISDYVVFKTEVLTKAKSEAKNQGILWGALVSIAITILGTLLKYVLKI
jgi:hypothetical protein